jgi:quinol monooxygenase YgiN
VRGSIDYYGSKESGMIHVIATIQVRPGRRDDFLTALRRIVPLVRAESGCVEYGPAVDLATPIAAQAPVRDDVVTVVEKWENLNALEAHLAAPHMADYREQVMEIVSGVQIQILEPA